MPASGSGPRRRQLSRHTMKQHEYQQPATGSETHLPHADTYLRTKTGSCVSETRPMARKVCLVGDPACIKVGALFPPPTLSECRHRRFACHSIAVRRRAILVMFKGL